MSNIIDFENVSFAGLESSPVSKSLAGLRAIHNFHAFTPSCLHAFTPQAARRLSLVLYFVTDGTGA